MPRVLDLERLVAGEFSMDLSFQLWGFKTSALLCKVRGILSHSFSCLRGHSLSQLFSTCG